jgi:IrrE N-terminal-like domain
METDYNINNIFNFLKNYGIDKKFVRDIILPDWWNDEIANSKVGYLQTAALITKNLGVNLSDFLGVPEELKLKENLTIKFKSSKNTNFSRELWPQSLALRISEMIKETFPDKFEIPFNTAADFRAAIIKKYNTITLKNLLEYLWEIGVPVLHVSVFPQNLKRMDGMVINHQGRPIIILSNNRKHDAWLLFILAHELGHIIKGHLSSSNNIIYDADLENIEEDNEEKEANGFALELITGTISPDFIPEKDYSPYQLLNLARTFGNELKIDPGILILNYAYIHNKFALAEQALKILNPKANAISVVLSELKTNLIIDKLSEENYDFFVKLTSLNRE